MHGSAWCGNDIVTMRNSIVSQIRHTALWSYIWLYYILVRFCVTLFCELRVKEYDCTKVSVVTFNCIFPHRDFTVEYWQGICCLCCYNSSLVCGVKIHPLAIGRSIWICNVFFNVNWGYCHNYIILLMVNWMVEPWMVHLWKISFFFFCRYVVWPFRCVCIKRVLWTTTQFSTKVIRISKGKTSSIHFLSFINLMFCWWLFKWDCYFSIRYLVVLYRYFFL